MRSRLPEGIVWGVVFSIPIWVGIIYLCGLLIGCESASVNNRDLLDVLKDRTADTSDDVQANVSAEESMRGFTHATPITDSLVLTGMYAHKATFSGNVREWGNSELTGEFHLFVLRDGVFIGGKADHIRDNTFQRDFNNIYNGYQIWSTLHPVKGEIVAMLFINYQKSKRTNAVFAEWKGN